MYNDFILVGPENDSLNLKEKAAENIDEAFKLIAEKKQNSYQEEIDQELMLRKRYLEAV